LAPPKTLLQRLDRIFCSNSAQRKSRNTQSIPDFSLLDLKQNLSVKTSESAFSAVAFIE